MTNIFTLENFQDLSDKINIDELYEKKRIKDLQRLELYKKILNRVHVKIKTTSKMNNDKFCWFVIPETIIGVPRYDRTEFKKKTGIIIDEFGNRIQEDDNEKQNEEIDQNNKNNNQIKNSKKYTPINSYKPSGKLVYSNDLINKLETKLEK
jgi:hypothetical protein